VESLDNDSSITVKGEWKKDTFTSDEVEIVQAGKYVIRDSLNGRDREFTCPELRFSCKLVELSIQECKMAGNGFHATFSLQGKGTSANDLRFQFRTPELKSFTYDKSSRSKELKDFRITNETNNVYAIDIDFIPEISVLQISHPECVGEYYVYSRMDCDDKEVVEQTGKKLKCGGYLDLEDRVRCRVALRTEEERYEHENFYPEECKSREDVEQCLKVYTDVQQCWDFPRGDKRISCVKEQLDLDDIRTERAKCKIYSGEAREQCNGTLRRKVFDLIKFRLYDLEEEAEHFMEEGLITDEDTADFIIKMERSKLSFNLAANKAERRSIILKARSYWVELIRKIKDYQSQNE